MKAAVLYELGAPLVVETLDTPPPGAGQVLVRVRASGVCHTQLLEARGKRGADPFLPHTLGHEGAGVVEATGPGVERVKPGDHVVLSWIKGPGLDPSPAVYRRGDRRINAGRVTTFQEYTIAPESRVTPVPATVPFDVAALIGCAVATGAGAVFNTARVEPGSAVVVFGAGGIGLAAIQAARGAGAARIVAVDVHDAKLARAAALGATDVVHALRADPVAAVRELTGGRGADYAIEAAGQSRTMEQAFQAVHADGGLAIVVGNLAAGGTITIDPFELIRGKRLRGTWGGETEPARDFPRLAELYLTGRLPIERLISHRFPLDEVNAALEALEKGDVARAVLEL